MLWLVPYCKRLCTCSTLWSWLYTRLRHCSLHGRPRHMGRCVPLAPRSAAREGGTLGREGSLVACRPSLALCSSSVWSSAARACPGLRPGLEQLGHRGASSGPASLPSAHGSGLVVWQTLAGAADGQRGARRSVAMHGGASDGASRHARGRDHPGPWGHRADLEHRSGTAHAPSDPRSLLRGSAAARAGPHGGHAGEERVAERLLAPRLAPGPPSAADLL